MQSHEWSCSLRELSAVLDRTVTSAELESVFARLGGVVSVAEDPDQRLRLTWRPATGSGLPLDTIVGWLQAGDYDGGMLVLEVLLGAEPESTEVLYNLGMAHSDRGAIPRARDLLTRLVQLEPEFTNGRVALGVAEMRLGNIDAAVSHFHQTVALDAANPWAHRNLGGALLKQGDAQGALSHLRRATELSPDDAQAWFGVGKASEELGDAASADAAYLRVIELAGFDKMADAAREARSKIAQESFRQSAGGPERMDAVMYCLDALERFDRIGEAATGQVVLEIALLGRSGLDVNDAERKYSLKTLPGQFSGLQLLSLMYVGMKQLQPEADVGFDLQKEFETAKGLYWSRKMK